MRENRQKSHEAHGEGGVSLFGGEMGLVDPLSAMRYERDGEERSREILRKAPQRGLTHLLGKSRGP
jgi:hypothetical protein